MLNRQLLVHFIVVFITVTYQNLIAQENIAVNANTSAGILQGTYDKDTGINSFLGIPYASPPVGDLRWKAPVPVSTWEGTKTAISFGNRPLQPAVFGDMRFRSESESEDCLYLNVWTPNMSTTGSRLPVLVYFHGGGFVAGDGSEYRYDGEQMATKGIVVVTVNYRLNIFGFFSHPELTKESPYGASGNYGLLDQQAALLWVKDNIQAFGGDPNNITIGGESAGSASVSIHMASPLSKNLIAAAIGESGAAIYPTKRLSSLQEAEKLGFEMTKLIGYPSLKKMREMPAKEIFSMYTKSNNLFGLPIVVDGYLLPNTLPEIFKSRSQAQVPLLLGWNSAEIPGVAFMGTDSYTVDEFVNRVKQKFPNRYASVLSMYPHTNIKEVEASAIALASDELIVFSTWKWYALHRRYNQQPIFRYLFAKKRPGEESGIGASHASEIEYCLGNLQSNPDYAWTKEDYAVSSTMQTMFANFIKNHDPNGSNTPYWPEINDSESHEEIMILDVNSHAREPKNDHRYRLLDEIWHSE